MKKVHIGKNSAVLVAVLLMVLLVLFCFSPLYLQQPQFVCYAFEEVARNPAYGEQIPACGRLIGGRAVQQNFSFLLENGDAVRFCLGNVDKIEEKCGVRVDAVLLDDGFGRVTCSYAALDKVGRAVQTLVDIKKTSAGYGEPGDEEIVVSSWKSSISNFSFKDTCTEAALGANP